MATTTLRRSDLGDLPPVCTKCGAAATEIKVEAFSWTPQWAQLMIFLGLLPWFIFVALTRQKATVNLPYCDAHIRHRPLLPNVVWAGLALGGVLLGLSVCVERWQVPVSSDHMLIAGLATVGLAVLLALFGNDGRARATHITRATVTLDQVSEKFAEAIRSGMAPASGTVSRRGGMELQTAKYYRGR